MALSEIVSPSEEGDRALLLTAVQSFDCLLHIRYYILDAVPRTVTASRARHRPDFDGALQAGGRGSC